MSDQTQAESYNGWTNRETWCVGLHLLDGGEAIYKEYINLLEVFRKNELGARSTFISAIKYLLGTSDNFVRDFSGWDDENPPHGLEGHFVLVVQLHGVPNYDYQRHLKLKRAQVVGAAWSKVNWDEVIDYLNS